MEDALSTPDSSSPSTQRVVLRQLQLSTLLVALGLAFVVGCARADKATDTSSNAAPQPTAPTVALDPEELRRDQAERLADEMLRQMSADSEKLLEDETSEDDQKR